MTTALLAGVVASPWARAALRYGAIALAVLLFLLALRRSGERAGRLAERLEPRKRPMKANAGCSIWQLAVLVIATISLTGCATSASEQPLVAMCPPVVEFDAAFLGRALEELELLSSDAAITDMLSDYAVMREQARACRGGR